MSDVQWLNITNAALGIVTAICGLAVVRAILIEVFSRRRNPEA